MSQFAEAADRLVRLGYHVFQLQPGSKMPFVPTAPNGCNSATGDPDVIQKWWTKYPTCNIGLKCDEGIMLEDLMKAAPGHFLLPISSFQVLAPATLHKMKEIAQGARISREAVVGIVPLNFRA